ncbi:MAG: DUF72 domain-containing protein [Balneolaceae bacterium]
MKFGSVDNPLPAELSLPDDHPDTAQLLSGYPRSGQPSVHVGCAKWNRQELKGFYPRGTKDELAYYASRFNAIELNATFYRNFRPEQVQAWYAKVPPHFRFFPKINSDISHRKWLSDIAGPLDYFLDSIAHFRDKLGTVFLQLRDNFSPKHLDRISGFLEVWPDDLALAIELRHTDWFRDPSVAGELGRLLEEHNVANIIVDTAGRRDLIHMRLTNNEAFIRFVGANHPSDYRRLDDWVDRLSSWHGQGLRNIHFFVHQNIEEESPVLASYFIRKLNHELGMDLTVPVSPDEEDS